MASGMSEGMITFGEIHSYAMLTGRRFSPWDVETLRILSGEYIAERHRASKMGCKPPFASPDLAHEPSAAQLAAREAASEAASHDEAAKARERRNALKRQRKQ